MYKSFMLLIFMMLSVQAQSFTQVVCMTDSAGRGVYLWGPDTSVILLKVIQVVYGSGGYTVTLKDGTEVKLPRPPFRRMELFTPIDSIKTDTVHVKKDTISRKEDRKSRK